VFAIAARTSRAWCSLSQCTTPAAVISVHDGERGAAVGELARFRQEVYRCLPLRADAVFELSDGAPRGAGVPDGGEKTTHLSVVVAAG
jgi:hypothetical protein